MMLFKKAGLPALFLASTLASGANADSFFPGHCRNVTFTVTATAANRILAGNLSDPSILAGIINGSIAISLAAPITYTSKLAATYCTPLYATPNTDTLQVYLSSITNNRGYWYGIGTPGQGFQGNNYSWAAYAGALGYSTLALDRLGTGESSHPDPVLVAQGPYEYQLYKNLFDIIRSGKGSALPRTFRDIVPIGNSYGSEIIANMARLFPTAFNRAVLTGYSYDVIADFPGITAVGPAPAAVVDPARFGNLAPGYLTTASSDGRRGAFYGGPVNVDYDNNIYLRDFANKDVVSIGQFLSVYLDGRNVAPAYSGRILVLTGEQDYAFCGPGSPLLGPAKCGQKLPDTKQLFPVSDYNWYSVNNTGHAIDSHYSRFETFGVAHKFLAGASFSKTG